MNLVNKDEVKQQPLIRGGVLFIRQDIKSKVIHAVFVVAVLAALLPEATRMALVAIDDFGAPIWMFYLAVCYVPIVALTLYRQLTMPIPCAAMID